MRALIAQGTHREISDLLGAGEGNRTLVFSLEGCCSTIELHPLIQCLNSFSTLVLARFWHRDGYIFVADRASPRNASVTIGPTGVAASDGRTQMIGLTFSERWEGFQESEDVFTPFQLRAQKHPPGMKERPTQVGPACSIDLRVAPRLCERALGPETSGGR
jgi:hypothetical protein